MRWSARSAAGRSASGAASLVAALAVGALGALIEMLVLRRIYAAPELFQLLATFALVLVIRTPRSGPGAPEDLLGPRAPGLTGAVEIAGRPFPELRPAPDRRRPARAAACCGCCSRARAGALLVRAATQDREMVGALGVNQRWLFTWVFALGTLLAGARRRAADAARAGQPQPRSGADRRGVRGRGRRRHGQSIGGAFVAAVLIAMVKAFCIAVGTVDVFGIDVPAQPS